ncbi:MAG: aminotransferase class I/II-fold pyridoxal phosphate-dependent enzyme [Victivallales bacterium]|nr:aminotransferase class I/II-fold pyridoxal phosphate-dependent enzyme [Victivallales bacterium]
MASKAFRGEVWTNVNPQILEQMLKVNSEVVDGNTGKDAHSVHAVELMQSYFRDPIYATYTINGTAANVIALKAMLDRFSAVLCCEQTHINCYECGATEYTLGNKILSIESPDGKLTPELLDRLLKKNKKYKYCPKVIVITEPTEFGTVYTIPEIKAICDYAHSKEMYVYVDGARISNAVAALSSSLTEMLEGTDVDAFSFGGTKAGAMFGEMVVFRRKEFARHLDYIQKQSMQHLDKSKFLGVQIEYLLETGIWLENAVKSNMTAKRLADKLHAKGVELFYKVETNMVFCVIPPEVLDRITPVFDMHYWDEFTHVVRLAVTHLTSDEEIDSLVALF